MDRPKLGSPVAGREGKKKKNKGEKQRGNIGGNENITANTLFVQGMPWHAYAVAVKSNGKGHRSLSYNTVMSTRVGISLGEKVLQRWACARSCPSRCAVDPGVSTARWPAHQGRWCIFRSSGRSGGWRPRIHACLRHRW